MSTWWNFGDRFKGHCTLYVVRSLDSSRFFTKVFNSFKILVNYVISALPLCIWQLAKNDDLILSIVISFINSYQFSKMHAPNLFSLSLENLWYKKPNTLCEIRLFDYWNIKYSGNLQQEKKKTGGKKIPWEWRLRVFLCVVHRSRVLYLQWLESWHAKYVRNIKLHYSYQNNIRTHTQQSRKTHLENM